MADGADEPDPADSAADVGARRQVIRDAVALGIAVGAFGLAFGALSVGAGLSVAKTCVLSLAMFTGGSQLAYVGVLAAGGSTSAAAASAVLLGSRNAFYGVALGPVLAIPRRWRPLAAHLVIDESTAMATGVQQPAPGAGVAPPVATSRPTLGLARLAFTATGLAVFCCWNLATLVGALGGSMLAGTVLGDPRVLGLDAVGPAAFLALLWPRLTTGAAPIRRVAGAGAVIGLIGSVVLPTGLGVPLAALGVLAAGRLAARQQAAGRGQP